MSLNKKHELNEIAKLLCRDLRKSQTNAELLLWRELRNRQLLGKKFLRQHPIFYDLNGKESFFIADFYCHEVKLIIEVDGIYHNYRLKEDKERIQILNMLGLDVMRIRNEEVTKDIGKVLSKIKDIIGNIN